MNGIPAETAHTGAGAPAEQPAKKLRSAAHSSHVAPSQARSGKKATPAKKANKGATSAKSPKKKATVARQGSKTRQGLRPPETLRRRQPEGTPESHRLAGALGPRVPVRRPGQEDGVDGHVHQGRGRGAPVLDHVVSSTAPGGRPCLSSI